MTPVVLLGGLNVVRALGMAGIPVIIASSKRQRPSMASRYCSGVIELPPIAEREAVVETLVQEAKRLGARAPLFYDNDDRLSLVQDFRAALAPHYALLLNEPELADALVEKARFQALAERTGLPVPRRFDWETLDGASGPVLAKPKSRTAWDNSSVRRQLFGGAGKACIFASGREARAQIEARAAQLADQLSFQEYVPGGDDAIWSFHGFAAPGGEVLEWFVGRKIRTWPALTGDSAYLALARDERLVALGREIARSLRLAGVFKMDFKRSASNDRYYLLEINTRFNLWHYLGACSGVNLPQVAYEFLTRNRRPLHAEAKPGVRWLCLHYDWRAYRELRARGELGFAGWLRSLAHFPMVYDLFSWSDPLPFVRHWLGTIRSAFQRRMHRWLATAS
jgi:predicted ATP-grasp superfamily ATP-dependent carboligase